MYVQNTQTVVDTQCQLRGLAMREFPVIVGISSEAGHVV